MAYRESACTDMNQVPGLIASFAQSVGWATETSGSAVILRRPGASSPVPLRVEAIKGAIVGTNYEVVAVGRQSLGSFLPGADRSIRRQFALVRSPWLSSGQRQPFIPQPSKLHCFGQGSTEPFLAFVVEYGFNVYRCLYIGTLTGGGDLGSGEVISVSTGTVGDTQGWFPTSQEGWAGLFSGRDYRGSDSTGMSDSRGGVHIAGKSDDVANGFSRFAIPSGGFDPILAGEADPGRGVWGGPRDGVDDQLLSAGFSPFSGNVFLQTVTLFTAVNSGTETRAAALGHVVGARAVNMRNVEPGSLHEIGNKLWRVFPQLRKNTDAYHRAGVPSAAESGGNRYCFTAEDTSWYWGMAFLQGDAG